MMSGNLRSIIKNNSMFHSGIKPIQKLTRANRRQFGQNYEENFRSYQNEFTIIHVTQLDVLSHRYNFLIRKMMRLRRFLKKEKIIDEFVNNIESWFFYHCSQYSKWIQECSKVVTAMNNFESQNFFEGQLRTQDEVRQKGVSDQFNIPHIIYQLSRKLEQNGIIISEATLFKSIQRQVKKGVLVLPKVLLSLVQRQKKLAQIKKTLEQMSQIRRQIHEITDQIGEQRRKMISFTDAFARSQRPRIINTEIGRKSAPVTLHVRKERYRTVQFPRQMNNIQIKMQGEQRLQLNVNGVFKQVPAQVEEVVIVVPNSNEQIQMRIKEEDDDQEFDAEN